jgi:hypothetical protein
VRLELLSGFTSQFVPISIPSYRNPTTLVGVNLLSRHTQRIAKTERKQRTLNHGCTPSSCTGRQQLQEPGRLAVLVSSTRSLYDFFTTRLTESHIRQPTAFHTVSRASDSSVSVRSQPLCRSERNTGLYHRRTGTVTSKTHLPPLGQIVLRPRTIAVCAPSGNLKIKERYA